MIVYKVTDRNSLSFVTSRFSKERNLKEDFVLSYGLNKITKPKYGKIFCFDSLEAAKDWADGESLPYKIYKCEAKKAKQRMLMLDSLFLYVNNIINYWEHYKSVLRRNSSGGFPILTSFPNHTVLCDWVMPIKIIEERE